MESWAIRNLLPSWSRGLWGVWRNPKTWASHGSWGLCGSALKRPPGILPCPSNNHQKTREPGCITDLARILNSPAFLRIVVDAPRWKVFFSGGTVLHYKRWKRNLGRQRLLSHMAYFKTPKQKFESTPTFILIVGLLTDLQNMFPFPIKFSSSFFVSGRPNQILCYVGLNIPSLVSLVENGRARMVQWTVHQ